MPAQSAAAVASSERPSPPRWISLHGRSIHLRRLGLVAVAGEVDTVKGRRSRFLGSSRPPRSPILRTSARQSRFAIPRDGNEVSRLLRTRRTGRSRAGRAPESFCSPARSRIPFALLGLARLNGSLAFGASCTPRSPLRGFASLLTHRARRSRCDIAQTPPLGPALTPFALRRQSLVPRALLVSPAAQTSAGYSLLLTTRG